MRKLEADLTAIEQYLLDICADTPREKLSKDYLNEQIDRFRHPEKYHDDKSLKIDFFEAFNEYLDKHPLAESNINHYKVLIRALRRYELYTTKLGEPYTFALDNITADTLDQFKLFLIAEPELFYKYPDIYQAMPADTHKVRKPRKPLPRGNNTLHGMFKRLRAFFNWCYDQGLTNNKPFAKFRGMGAEKYGTPYYITIREREKIANFDLSATPELEIQRDIFIFQCFIGCRVSDLLRLTPANIINGAVEYIATKTKQERPEVIRVPLHPHALTLLEKYEGRPDGRLLPFISSQRYNDAIKSIFTKAGITRAVTILNPSTGQEEQRPLNEIASSHIARRTFVGNLYKQVKDPNLVGALSGHKEGSRAFARYRDIDEDIKKDLINLL